MRHEPLQPLERRSLRTYLPEIGPRRYAPHELILWKFGKTRRMRVLVPKGFEFGENREHRAVLDQDNCWTCTDGQSSEIRVNIDLKCRARTLIHTNLVVRFLRLGVLSGAP